MVDSLAYYTTVLRKGFTEYCNQRLQEMGLTQGLLFYILYVGKHPGCAPKALTEALHMDVGHTTRTLAKLEQGGFLVQLPNPKDKRAHILQLTPVGEAAFKASHELFIQWDDQVMSGLSGEERGQLMGLLHKMLGRKGGEADVRDHFEPGCFGRPHP